MIDENGGKIDHDTVQLEVKGWQTMQRVFDYDGKVWKFPAAWGVNEKKSGKMKRPTTDEVRDFMVLNHGHLTTDILDAESQKFYDFYQSKGWVVGKAPMKDWKASARRWMNEVKFKSKPNGEKIGSRVTRQDAADLVNKVAQLTGNKQPQAGG